MTHMPGAIWQPVGNYTDVTIAHVGVVEHVTAGESNPWGWFNSSAAQASSHLFIGNGQGGVPDGQITQFVDLGLKAWAEAAGNTSYISVETEGQPQDALTKLQVLAFASIMAFAHTDYGIPLVTTDTPGNGGLICHGDGGVAWGNHPDCPGQLRANQRGGILYIAALSLGGNANPITPRSGGPTNMITPDPTTGGFWSCDVSGDTGNYNGAPLIPGLNTHPAWQAGQNESGGKNQVVGLSTFKDKNAAYGLVFQVAPAGANPDVTGYSYYRIARDGTPD